MAPDLMIFNQDFDYENAASKEEENFTNNTETLSTEESLEELETTIDDEGNKNGDGKFVQSGTVYVPQNLDLVNSRTVRINIASTTHDNGVKDYNHFAHLVYDLKTSEAYLFTNSNNTKKGIISDSEIRQNMFGQNGWTLLNM